MKNNFLSLKGIRMKGRGMNAPEITRQSPGNHPRITRVWKVITSTLLLLFTFAIGQMWGTTSYYNLFYNGTDKSVDGSTINSADYKYFGATINTSASSTTIDGNTYTHYIKLANYTSTIAADSMKVLAYDAKTTHTKVTAYVKNGDTNARDFYIGRIVEGETTEQTGSGKQVKQNVAKGATAKVVFELDNTTNTLIGIFGAGKATWEIYQVIVEESGTPLLTGGETGYELAFPGRVGASGKFTAGTTPTIIDGMELRASNSLKYLTGPLKLKQTNSYIKFTLTSSQTVKVTPYNTRKFIFSTTATPSGTETKYGGTAASEVSVVLTEGTYFLESESSSELQLSKLAFAAPPTPHTLSYAVDPAGKGTVTLGTTSLIEGATTTATYSAIDAAYEFDEWQISGTGASIENASANPAVITMGSVDATVTLKLKAAVTKYTITYNPGAYGTGTAIPDGKKDEGVDFTLSSSTYSRDGYVQTGWATEDGGAKAYELGGTYSTDADEDLFPFWTPVYTVTKGTHEHGDFTISPASLVAGGTVTLDPTPADGYMFSAWEVVKTSDASATGITVTNKQFEMPAYGVTVNATFVTDTRKKILYVTSNNEATTKSSDMLYAALKDNYNVTIVGPTSDANQSTFDLIVLHESVGGSNYGATAVATAKTGNKPVLNTKSYFYNDGRWGWGTPNAGKSVKGATLNSAYCNIADHPLFSGVTVTAGFFEITDDAVAKCMQPLGSFTDGKQGYILATTPNNDSGDGAAIHELTPAQRGASAGKYLLISVLGDKLNALNANGQKLFQNAAAYLTGSTTWTPITVPTSPEVTATPSENYTEGNTITLTASATGTTASTTYTWYKGDDWATASATTPVQAAATAASDGNVFTKTAALADAGTYWCNISNGTSCDAQASVTITVSSASTPTHAITYDNTKGADMSAYPTEYTEGVGIASFAALADITGWHFVEWSPATIETTATTDQTITAVWAQVFEVTFNLQGHGASIDAQNIVDGGKVTKPDDPVAIGWDFGGWFTDAECTAGNEWDFDNDVVTEATELFAKWTAFAGCTLLYPATSGDAPAVGDPISMQSGSKGGSMSVIGTPLSYNTYGLGFDSNASAKAKVTINNEIQEGTVISLTLVANGTSARGLHLYTGDGSSKVETLGWTSEVVKYTEATFTYTVQSTDVALIGSNEFQLWRNNSVFLKELTVTNCGDPVISHNLTSAITPDHDPAYATVTLGASSVREGHTTTAEYSAIDPTYEFVSWSISGEGATLSSTTANPVTITMGTEDAVITLNLQVKPVYYTVTYYDGASEMGTEEVAENGHPTATGIATKKLGYNFLGWSEIDGGAVVNLNDITITAAKNLYAKYEAVVCPTSGTVYKFQMKTDLVNGNVFDSKPNSVAFTTDNYLSVLTGGILTGSIDNNNVNRLQFFDNKAVGFASGSGGTLTIGLDCALEEGDVIKYINYASSGNSATLSDGVHTQTLNGNGSETVQTWDVPAAWDGATELTLVRGGNTAKITYFEIYRRPVATGASLADLTIRQGQSKTPVMTLEPSADARVTSQAWEITASTNLTDAGINATTGAITTGTLDDPLSTGSISVKVTLNGSIVATCTATVVGNIDQQNVTNSTIWNWQNTGATANIQLSNTTDPKKNENFVLANVSVNNNASFESDKLAVEGEYMVRDYDKTNPYFQGQLIQFHTTVAGKVRVKFSHTGNATAEKPARELYINGTATGETRDNATPAWSSYIEVPAGDVSITAYYVNLLPEATQQYIRIFEIEFLALAHQRTSGYAAGDLGTVCLEDATIIEGANLYELAGLDQYGYLAFDQILSGELEAGKPYLFEVTNPSNISFYKPVGAAHSDDEIANKGMIGTFTGTTLNQGAEDYYYFSGRHIWKVNDFTVGVPIPAHRCYVDMDVLKAAVAPAPMPGRVRMTIGVNGKNTPTAIDNAEASDKPAKMLINGQLFILRGDKTYDVTGKLVK